MGNLWYTSDLHIGHQHVAELRGFINSAAHDAVLAANWDHLVRPDDTVWVLGDISIGGKRQELAALEWITQRPGTKHLIAGNHDACHPMRSRAHLWQPVYLGARWGGSESFPQGPPFASVQSDGVRRILGHRVLMSHFPYAGDPDGDHTPESRFEEWRRPDTGQWLLHGHTHSPVAVRGRQLHVGLDAHSLRPVPQSWVDEQILAAS